MPSFVYNYHIYVGSTGLLFPYSLGVLAYIKSNLKPEFYHLSGVSGGSWCSILYILENNLNDHDELWYRYIGDKNTKIAIFDKTSMIKLQDNLSTNIIKRYNNTNVDNFPLSIYVSRFNKNGIHNIAVNNYNNLEDVVSYSKCSSYIPFICGNGLWKKYKNQKYIDGVFYHTKPEKIDVDIDVNKLLKKYSNQKIKQRICLDINKSKYLYNLGWNYAEKHINKKNDI